MIALNCKLYQKLKKNERKLFMTDCASSFIHSFFSNCLFSYHCMSFKQTINLSLEKQSTRRAVRKIDFYFNYRRKDKQKVVQFNKPKTIKLLKWRKTCTFIIIKLRQRLTLFLYLIRGIVECHLNGNKNLIIINFPSLCFVSLFIRKPFVLIQVRKDFCQKYKNT